MDSETFTLRSVAPDGTIREVELITHGESAVQ
jgi:hypothetical protein